jgi:hypothetical protein
MRYIYMMILKYYKYDKIPLVRVTSRDKIQLKFKIKCSTFYHIIQPSLP